MNPTWHSHPQDNSQRAYGVAAEPDEVISEGMVFANELGFWDLPSADVLGSTVELTGLSWVRTFPTPD